MARSSGFGMRAGNLVVTAAPLWSATGRRLDLRRRERQKVGGIRNMGSLRVGLTVVTSPVAGIGGARRPPSEFSESDSQRVPRLRVRGHFG